MNLGVSSGSNMIPKSNGIPNLSQATVSTNPMGMVEGNDNPFDWKGFFGQNGGFIGSLATKLVGAIGNGVLTAINTNQKAQAYRQAASELSQAANDYSGSNLNKKMTESGLKNAEWNRYNLETNLGESNPSGIGMSNFKNADKSIQNDSNYMGLYSEGANREKAINDAKYNATAAKVGRNIQQADTNFAVNTQAAQAGLSAVGGIADFANQAVSDENEKTKLPHADIQDSLRQIDSITYKYKNPNVDGADEGVNVGSTAQSMQKTALFGDAVVDSADGLKRVDQKKLLEAVEAGIAELQREIDDAE